MKKLKIAIPLLLTLVLLINTTTLLNPVAASPQAILVPWSPDYDWFEIIDDTLVPGYTFDIQIRIYEVLYLYGFEFKLRYDPTVLNATALTLGDMLPPDYSLDDPDPKVWKEEINRDVGYVWYAVSMALGSQEYSPYTWGILATISFELINNGGSLLDLDDTLLGSYPGDPTYGEAIDHEVIDGLISNVGIPPVASFWASRYDPEIGESVTFNAGDSYDPDENYPLTYSWDFGDGTNDTMAIPTIAHAYELPGIYTVVLTVIDARTAKGKTEDTITVYGPRTEHAELSEWKAKPRYKNLDISRRGTTVNNLYALVVNLCNITDPVVVKVNGTVNVGGIQVGTFETNEYTFEPLTYLATTDDWAIQYGWHGLNTTAAGQFDVGALTESTRFFVTARAWYELEGVYQPGTVTKTFSFVAKP